MMFPWFLLALRLEHGGICKKAALRKQEGSTGSSMPPGWKKMHSTKSWQLCKPGSDLYLKCCESRSEITVHLWSWGPTSLTVMVQRTSVRPVWVSDRMTHSGPCSPWPGAGAAAQRRCRLPGADAAPVTEMPLLALHTLHCPEGPCRSPWVHASGPQGHLQQLLLAERRWSYSKSRRLFLAGCFGLLLPVPVEMAHSSPLPTLGTGAAPKENQQQPSLPAPRGFVPSYQQGEMSALQR